MDWTLVALGLGVGILVGTTGMGGGSLMTPLLILVLGVKPVIAIGTDLVYGAVTKTVGGWRSIKAGTVDFGVSTWLAAGSVPGAILGVLFLTRLRNWLGSDFDSTVLILVAAALLLTAIAVISRALFLPRVVADERHAALMERREKIVAATMGLVIGFVLSVTSAGSGSLIAVGLILFFRLKPRRVVGTDVFHAAILLWVAGIAHMIEGNVDFGLAGNILVGSVPGVWIGTSLQTRLPDSGLRPALGVVLLASGLALLNKAGASVIGPGIILGAPAGVAAVALVTHRARAARAARRRQQQQPQAAPA